MSASGAKPKSRRDLANDWFARPQRTTAVNSQKSTHGEDKHICLLQRITITWRFILRLREMSPHLTP
jgi:hypothetical protein